MIQSLKKGDVVGFYEIIVLLEEGEGGMSAVFEAKRRPHYALPGYPDRVALKVALPTYEDQLRTEAMYLCRFNHRNIVKSYGLRQVDGTARVGHASLTNGALVVYMAMELLSGGSLTKRIEQRGRLSLREANLVARDLALALQHIHSKGVLSLDVKPDNVLFRGNGRRTLGSYPPAVLCDFGIARDMGNLSTGEHAGTPGYTAPEQIIYGRVDPRRLAPVTDIFQWGVVYYLMIAGELPFGFDASMLVDPGYSAPPLSSRRRVPREIDQMVQRALQKEPARRYQGTDELLNDMKKLRLPSTRDL